jgi:hypothetical protein
MDWGVCRAADETARSTQGFGGEKNARFWGLVLGRMLPDLVTRAVRIQADALLFQGFG